MLGRKEEKLSSLKRDSDIFSFGRKPQGSRLPSCKIKPGRKRNKHKPIPFYQLCISGIRRSVHENKSKIDMLE